MFFLSPSLRFDLRMLPVDFVECLLRFIPTEPEVKMLRQYEKEKKPLENLTDEDRFMMQFSKIERLMQKMTIMAFVGNFNESVQMLTPVSSKQKSTVLFIYIPALLSLCLYSLCCLILYFYSLHLFLSIFVFLFFHLN